MKNRIAAIFLTLLAASAKGASMTTAPLNSTTSTSQYGVAPAPLNIRPIAGTSTAPAIKTIMPADCVTKGGQISIQGDNLLTSAGHSIAIDDGNGTHIELPIVKWSGIAITATVPDDTRVQEGGSYRVGMETVPGQWISNTDMSITICAAASQPAANAPQAASHGSSLLAEGLPPPSPAQNVQNAPIKEDVTVEPGEIVVVSADMNEAGQLQQNAQALGYGIKRRSVLGNLGLVVSVLRVPSGTTVANALAQLRQAMPNTWMDANHRYQLESGEAVLYANGMIAWSEKKGCAASMPIGLIDTATDTTQPLLKGRSITQRSFLASGIVPAPTDHGTAIASIFVASAPNGLLPNAQLYVAEIFRARGDRQADTTAESIVKALDWLVGEKVQVINLSFGGSHNLLLEAAIGRVLKRGIVIVAAAGNGGPDAPPVYPAAQDGVIAVTAVDANLRAYDHANRGDYIAYAAPGVDVWVAAPGKGGVYATGTSYAAPFVAAVIAASEWAHPGIARPALDTLLEAKVRDLGAQGRDKIYGWGLIQMPVECVRGAGKSSARSKR